MADERGERSGGEHRPARRLLTVREAAGYVGVTEMTMRRLLKQNPKLAQRVLETSTGQTWVKMPALEAWLRGEEATLPPAE